MPRALSMLLVCAFVAIVAAADAGANGFLVPVGAEHAAKGWGLEHCRVDVLVRGPHARVTVEQTFRNPGSRALEADYLFPLPAGAMVSSLTLLEDGEGLEGRLLRAEDARQAYEAIVRRRKDPALLQYLGHDVYRVRLFPIPAGERRTVVLHYDQALATDTGLCEWTYPLGAARLAAASWAQLVLNADIETGAPLGSVYRPTHDVRVVRPAPNRAQISYQGPCGPPGDDLLLYWSTTTRRIGASLLTWWPADEDLGTFLLLVSPTLRAPDPQSGQPQNVTFVVDTSGSMAGEKLEQVRGALTQILPALGAHDRFNVIAYSTSVLALWTEPHRADEEARRQALEFVQTLRAGGGTHIEGALRSALGAAPQAEDQPSVILFLTDGRPTLGEADPERLLAGVRSANVRGAVRLFVLGVGVDVNTVMLDRLALENRGTPTFVRPREDVELKISALYEKIRRPALTDLTLSVEGARVVDLLPAQLPDLFHGGQLVVAGRYTGGGAVHVTLRGRDGALAREYHYVLPAAPRGQSQGNDFPARVWATRRIAELLDAIRLHKRQDPELVDEIVRLSTKFGILTEYTSFLADETGVSHSELAVNARRTRKNLDALTERAVGGAGLAQSANQAQRRDAPRATPPSYFLPTPGDRDVQRVDLSGVRQAGNRTFYYRGATLGWVDVNVPDSRAPDEVILRWSPRFYEVLRTTTAAENVRLAQTGVLLLELGGRVVRIVDGS